MRVKGLKACPLWDAHQGAGEKLQRIMIPARIRLWFLPAAHAQSAKNADHDADEAAHDGVALTGDAGQGQTHNYGVIRYILYRILFSLKIISPLFFILRTFHL